jgi:hypothetical protein
LKLFKSLLVAPATLGLLAPINASATEVNLKAISNYSYENSEIDLNTFKTLPKENLLLSGGEGLVDSASFDGGFSETTTASFSLDTVIGAVDGGNDSSEALTFDYSMNIGLSTSFTGEDSLDVTIDVGNGAYAADGSGKTESSTYLDFQGTSDQMVVDGITYTFPLGGATVLIGDTTDISSTFTGACAYSAFTDLLGDCGTGNSVGVGGKGVTASASYAFDSGFSLAGGVSSVETEILTKEGKDLYGIEAAYTADTYGVSVAYVSDDGGTGAETTYWGVNAFYAPENASLPSISGGIETSESGGTDKSGYFVGLTWPEVGPGSVSLGLATNKLYADSETEYFTYEASYSYPINDGMTVTPGVFIAEQASGVDDTGVLVKTSFSF